MKWLSYIYLKNNVWKSWLSYKIIKLLVLYNFFTYLCWFECWNKIHITLIVYLWCKWYIIHTAINIYRIQIHPTSYFSIVKVWIKKKKSDQLIMIREVKVLKLEKVLILWTYVNFTSLNSRSNLLSLIYFFLTQREAHKLLKYIPFQV